MHTGLVHAYLIPRHSHICVLFVGYQPLGDACKAVVSEMSVVSDTTFGAALSSSLTLCHRLALLFCN